MKQILTFIFILFFARTFSYGRIDSLNLKLNEVMLRKEFYDKEKEKRISSLKEFLCLENLTISQRFDINEKIIDEYNKFKTDSAEHYVLENITLAEQLGNSESLEKTQLHLAWLYSTRGKYLEAKRLLDSINPKKKSKAFLADYYRIYNEFYSHYGLSNNDDAYYKQSELYRDSLLSILDHNSFEYKMEYAIKLVYYDQYAAEAIAIFESLLKETTDSDPERALIAYFLGYTYKRQRNIEKQKYYFTISAICDITNCIKDNASLQNLALTYYELGDIDSAYKCIQSAIEDAIYCNVRYRTIESSEFYPIINLAYQAKENTQKEKLQHMLAIISLLSVLLIIVLVYIYKQMQKLAKIKNALKESNRQLTTLNEDLKESNLNLEEANHIKEEYIGRFFDQCSAYIEKLENYRKMLNQKAKNNQLDELFTMLKSNTMIEAELKELYETFDSIFLKIYPNFIEEFNELLLPEERIYPKQDELLTTELRIYALIRLGITDSNKIASFLRYSLRTVYNYRTKVRNKSAVSRDEFEDYVKRIGLRE